MDLELSCKQNKDGNACRDDTCHVPHGSASSVSPSHYLLFDSWNPVRQWRPTSNWPQSPEIQTESSGFGTLFSYSDHAAL